MIWDQRLLRFLLLLLSDADLEVHLLGFLERLVVMPRYGIAQILIHIGAFRQNDHDCERFFALGAERPEAFDIRNRHSNLRLSQAMAKRTSPHPIRPRNFGLW